MSYKRYYENGWQSGESGGTPITPEALNHIEDGIVAGLSEVSSLLNGKIIAVAKSITFTDGIGTYENSAIASGAIAFAQFRASQVATLADTVLGVYPNAGSVTIVSKMGQSGALPVLILVINP